MQQTRMSASFVADTALPCTVVPSPNHGDRRGRAIDALVLHYTGMPSADAALARLCDPAAQVSSHYLIDEAGTIFQLVAEARRAWHAGRSFWRGERDLNSVSIGIEIANAGHDGGLPAFANEQIEAVTALCREIMARHGIPAHRLLGHSDISPGRKVDPGERFPWQRLASAGVGIWPPAILTSPRVTILAAGSTGTAITALQQKLRAWGMDVLPTGTFDSSTQAAVVAFQQRFRPSDCAGVFDAETAACLVNVVRITQCSSDAF